MLKFHKHIPLRWVKCECGKGKVPNDMHFYWHHIQSTTKTKDSFDGLSYTCPKCKQMRTYNPTFDITVTI